MGLNQLLWPSTGNFEKVASIGLTSRPASIKYCTTFKEKEKNLPRSGHIGYASETLRLERRASAMFPSHPCSAPRSLCLQRTVLRGASELLELTRHPTSRIRFPLPRGSSPALGGTPTLLHFARLRSPGDRSGCASDDTPDWVACRYSIGLGSIPIDRLPALGLDTSFSLGHPAPDSS